MNEQFKPYKTVEQIAKKHRMKVSFIQNQLDMGKPIEHEHTKDHKLAREIALQHLDEIPDYYTRLKKMETDAKKHHKQFKDVKEETKSGDEGLHDWFNKSKSSDGKRGWVQLGGKYAGKPCARQPGQTSTPKCGSSKMATNLSSEQEERSRERKNRQDPNQPQKTDGAKPTNVRTEEMDLQEVKDKPGKGSGKKDACYSKVKSRYDVWPSAYASGALVKCRKVGAANWGTKSEDCWDGYEQKGLKKKGKKIVPNCVPVKEEKSMVKYCPLCKKNETKSECSFGPSLWEKYSIAKVHPANEEKDYEQQMARNELQTAKRAIDKLMKKLKGEGNMEAWVQSKISKASDYLDSVSDYMEGDREEIDEALRSREERMARMATPKSRKEQEKKRALRSKAEEILSDIQALEKGKETKKSSPKFNTPAAEVRKLKTGQKKDTLATKALKAMKEESNLMRYNEYGQTYLIRFIWRGLMYGVQIFIPSLKRPSSQEIKSQLDKIYPGAQLLTFQPKENDPVDPTIVFAKEDREYRKMLAKERKAEREHEKDWRSTSKIGEKKSGPKLSSTKKSERSGKEYADYQERSISAHDKATKGKHTIGSPFAEQNEFDLDEAKVDDKLPEHERSAQRNKRYSNPSGALELGGGKQRARRAEHEARRGKPKRWWDDDGDGIGWEKGEVKKEEVEIQEVAAWQRKEGKNTSGGLNEKGRKSYERENPGSDLKAPSKKVGNKRRASFCARMSGMKKKLTSSKTANDPNSRINKSLRAWNC